MDREILEEASDLCHQEWMDWSKSIAIDLNQIVKVLENDVKCFEEKGVENKEAIEILEKTKNRLKRWENLWVPYDELSEEMKEEDRIYARKILNLIKE